MGPTGGDRTAGPGPIVLVLPLVFFVLSVLYLSTAHWQRAPARRPTQEPPALDLEGWTGSSEAPPGLRLTARLSRLHADPLRQAFEADALRRQLLLAPGEPWRLELRVLPVPEGPDAAVAEGVSLSGLEVRDEDGPALQPLVRQGLGPGQTGAAPADPLAVLLALPDELHAGREAGLVLWGREPAGGARLVGLRALGAAVTITLAPSALDPPTEESALARLDAYPRPRGDAEERGQPGTTTGGPSSETRDENESD